MRIVILFLVAIAGLLIMLYYFLRAEEISRENENVRVYLDSLRTYYSILEDQIYLARRYRHDLAGHIRTLGEMMRQSENKNALQMYQDVLIEQQRSIQKEAEQMISLSSSELINAIVYVFTERCREEGIQFETAIDRLADPGEKRMDLSALIYNLLENATEECQKIKPDLPRRIVFEMKKNDSEKNMRIYLTVINTVREGKRLIFRSEKEDPGMHGIGDGVIRQIAAQYHGSVQDTVIRQDGLMCLKREILL